MGHGERIGRENREIGRSTRLQFTRRRRAAGGRIEPGQQFQAKHARQALVRVPALGRQTLGILARDGGVVVPQRRRGIAEIVGRAGEPRAGFSHRFPSVDAIAVLRADAGILHLVPFRIGIDEAGLNRQQNAEVRGALEIARLRVGKMLDAQASRRDIGMSFENRLVDVKDVMDGPVANGVRGDAEARSQCAEHDRADLRLGHAQNAARRRVVGVRMAERGAAAAQRAV